VSGYVVGIAARGLLVVVIVIRFVVLAMAADAR
jgi:hypothetical protein